MDLGVLVRPSKLLDRAGDVAGRAFPVLGGFPLLGAAWAEVATAGPDDSEVGSGKDLAAFPAGL